MNQRRGKMERTIGMTISSVYFFQTIHKLLGNSTNHLSLFSVQKSQKRKSASKLSSQISISFHKKYFRSGSRCCHCCSKSSRTSTNYYYIFFYLFHVFPSLLSMYVQANPWAPISDNALIPDFRNTFFPIFSTGMIYRSDVNPIFLHSA